MHHVRASMHGIRRRGLSERLVLERAGINPAIIHNDGLRVHTDQVARLFALVQQELDDEFMDFTPSPCRHGLFNLMCELVSGAGSLRDLLGQAIRFYNLVSRDLGMQLHESGSRAMLDIQLKNPVYDPENFLAEFLLVIWHRFPSWMIGAPIKLKETHFNFAPPGHLRELMIMFPGGLEFNEDSNRLVFDVQYLDQPLVRSRAEIETFLDNAPAGVMTIPGTDGTLESQIERFILSRTEDYLDFPTIHELARQLGLGVPTLHRRLKQAGSHYQKIKDDLRREMAIRKLVDERWSVERVSELVGYSEPRSFTRAFKQWTGLSPRQYITQSAPIPRNSPAR